MLPITNYRNLTMLQTYLTAAEHEIEATALFDMHLLTRLAYQNDTGQRATPTELQAQWSLLLPMVSSTMLLNARQSDVRNPFLRLTPISFQMFNHLQSKVRVQQAQLPQLTIGYALTNLSNGHLTPVTNQMVLTWITAAKAQINDRPAMTTANLV